MLNRRLFLQTSTATLTAIASTNPALAKGMIKNKEKIIDTVLYDDRFSGCSQFASDAVAQGAKSFPIHEDLNETCYTVLTEQFNEQKTVVAGFTKDHVAGYIQALARDYSYQQVHFTELEPELSALITKENHSAEMETDNDSRLVAWVLAPIYNQI